VGPRYCVASDDIEKIIHMRSPCIWFYDDNSAIDHRHASVQYFPHPKCAKNEHVYVNKVNAFLNSLCSMSLMQFMVLQDFDWRNLDDILCIARRFDNLNILITSTMFFPQVQPHVTQLSYIGHADRTSEQWMWKAFFSKCVTWREFKNVMRNKQSDDFILYNGTHVLKMYKIIYPLLKDVDPKMKMGKCDDNVVKRIEELEEILMYAPGQSGAKEASDHFQMMLQ